MTIYIAACAACIIFIAANAAFLLIESISRKKSTKKETYAVVNLFAHPHSFLKKEYKKRSLRLCKPLRHLYSVFVSPDPGFVHWWMHSPPLERTALCGVFGYAA